MRKYQIKDLERITGIKAHTIRIWEKRYKLLTPERSATNIRYYKDDDLKKLLNISLLLLHGSKISKLSEFKDEEINAQVNENLQKKIQIDKNTEPFLIGLTIAMIELNEEKFNQIYLKALHKMGFYQTMIQLIYPFLIKIGLMWRTNEINPAQEHFITNLIRSKMLSAIEDLPNVYTQKDEYILYLPQNELHETGLMFAHYLLKERGYKVIYLGQSVPFRDLKILVEYVKPTHVMTILTSTQTAEAIKAIVNNSLDFFTSNKVVFVGLKHYENQLKLSSKIICFNGVSEFIEYIG